MLRVVMKESRDVTYIAPGIDVEAVIEMSCQSQKISDHESSLLVQMVLCRSMGGLGVARGSPGFAGYVILTIDMTLL